MQMRTAAQAFREIKASDPDTGSSPNCGVNCSSRIFAYAASSNAC